MLIIYRCEKELFESERDPDLITVILQKSPGLFRSFANVELYFDLDIIY